MYIQFSSSDILFFSDWDEVTVKLWVTHNPNKCEEEKKPESSLSPKGKI